ncbi:orotate phosphoribosyltransferase [Elizabethkingia argentiflava]|uniref:Orotate phosphoribosyltransferase n=1 Tax=Elizabethkingia argenteiflava TaxID=2681556 RepID=A0A845PWD1_9FLAO|nr:orotate phosphoribosyltransferase [Elizabethkingia argenteiflava]NAW51176.1 orotate phosphoribosyltransferase [Elizabethkingia argenteiflava]
MKTKRAFFLEAYKLGIIKFGKFTLKSGIESPFYVDLRPLASDPKILKQLSNYLLEILPLDNFDLICGVPYAALPMATAMSLESYIPLILKRKEAKTYGTKKLIEGLFHKGQNCLLVEDVITSGKSLLETIYEVENEGLKVSDIIVVLDRQQGGREKLQEKGYQVHTLFTISEIVKILQEEQQLTEDEVERIHDFLGGHSITFEEKKKTRYEEKLKNIDHPVATRLLEIALQKKSNLIASADVTTTQELLNLAETLGPHIAGLKTHIDIIRDFDYQQTILRLKDIAEKHDFLLMEDRKFGDIGNTQELQFSQGMYKISNWADMVTAHAIGGTQALQSFAQTGIIAILGMSSKSNLTDAHYREEAMKIITNNPNVIGCVAQNQIQDDLLLFTPGVHLTTADDDKGQQYRTPEYVFKKLHTDFIIVGRGIYKAENIEQAALTYKIKGWEAYENAIS